jgi:hypothetical protein
MPVLDNPRWELYAQAVARGVSRRQAYTEAYGRSGTTQAVSALGCKPLVKHRVKEIQAEAASVSADVALARKEYRLQNMQRRHDLLMQVIKDRATDMEFCEACRRPREFHSAVRDVHPEPMCRQFVQIPGGTTGLVIRKLKREGFEYAVDIPVLAELRELERRAAEETGDAVTQGDTAGVTGTLEELLVTYRRLQITEEPKR